MKKEYRKIKDIYDNHCEFINEADCIKELDEADINFAHNEYWWNK